MPRGIRETRKADCGCTVERFERPQEGIKVMSFMNCSEAEQLGYAARDASKRPGYAESAERLAWLAHDLKACKTAFPDDDPGLIAELVNFKMDL